MLSLLKLVHLELHHEDLEQSFGTVIHSPKDISLKATEDLVLFTPREGYNRCIPRRAMLVDDATFGKSAVIDIHHGFQGYEPSQITSQ